MVNRGDKQQGNSESAANMLIGEHRKRLVTGNRVVIPASFRDTLSAQELIITKGYESSLILLNPNMWNQMLQEVQGKSYFNRSLRETTRFLVGSASAVTPDKQGRVVLSETHLEHLRLKPYSPQREQNLVFVGLINWIEIWHAEAWLDHHDFLAQNGEKLAEELSNLATKKE